MRALVRSIAFVSVLMSVVVAGQPQPASEQVLAAAGVYGCLRRRVKQMPHYVETRSQAGGDSICCQQ
jgi:hypothetical protein